MRRRDFIKATALAFLSQPLQRIASASVRPKVAIIGAGVAGLSTAHHLKKHGIPAVVFEASNRTGGRVFTKKQSDCVLEWGANWIHGDQKNPLYEFTRKMKMETKQTPEESSREQVFEGKKKVVLNHDFRSRLQFFRNAEEKIISLGKGKKSSVLDELIRLSNSENWTKEQLEWTKFFFKLYVEENYGAAISEVDASQFSSASWYSGGDYVLPNGYNQIPIELSKGLQIHLGKKLKRIERLSKRENLLLFEDGNFFHCSHAVITVSLGVLKSAMIEFAPSLPQEKLEAIQRLGFGRFTKVFVRLRKGCRKKISHLPTWIKFFGDSSSSSFQFFHLSKFSRCPFLIGIAVGKEAILLEGLNSSELKSYLLSRAPFLGADDIESIEATDWGNNELYQGSYSFPRFGSNETDFDVLGQSLENIHFAGEACQSDIYGTVEAAFVSGKRMADRIKGLL